MTTAGIILKQDIEINNEKNIYAKKTSPRKASCNYYIATGNSASVVVKTLDWRDTRSGLSLNVRIRRDFFFSHTQFGNVEVNFSDL